MPWIRSLLALPCLFVLAWSTPAAAQFPTRTLTIVVPFTPGGSNDIFARAIAQDLGRIFNHPVVVENRPGGGSSVGSAYVAKAAPDGYTLMLNSSSFTINGALNAKLPFHPVNSFTAIALVGKGPMMFVGSTALKQTSLGELIAASRAKPGSISYASAGLGSTNQMGSEMLASAAGVKFTHVPYKGGAQAMNDLIGNHVDVYLGSIPQVMPSVRSGKVKAIAITSPQRAKFAPDVPAVAETVPDYSLELWWGIFGPAGMPHDVVTTLNTAINNVLATPKMTQFLANEAAEPGAFTSEQFREFLARELQRWQKVARDANIAME